jgi:hypothetical protein
MDVQLFVNVQQMHADGGCADMQVSGNFLIGETLGNQGENLQFPCGKLICVS